MRFFCFLESKDSIGGIMENQNKYMHNLNIIDEDMPQEINTLELWVKKIHHLMETNKHQSFTRNRKRSILTILFNYKIAKEAIKIYFHTTPEDIINQTMKGKYGFITMINNVEKIIVLNEAKNQRIVEIIKTNQVLGE